MNVRFILFGVYRVLPSRPSFCDFGFFDRVMHS